MHGPPESAPHQQQPLISRSFKDLTKTLSLYSWNQEGKTHKQYLPFKEMPDNQQAKGIGDGHVQMRGFYEDKTIVVLEV